MVRAAVSIFTQFHFIVTKHSLPIVWNLKYCSCFKRPTKSLNSISRWYDIMSVSGKKTDMRVFKIIVIGDSGVGKTCLTFRFCSGKFPGKTEVTIGVDFREKCVDAEGEIIKLQLWDTAGQERFRKSMIQHYYRNVNAVVFVYDVTNPGSFDSLPGWISECEKYNLTRAVPRILIGNKLDCGPQLVPTNNAQMFADLHSMPLFETSALDDSHANHVESIFMTLAHKLRASRPMMGPSATDEALPSVVLHRADVLAVQHSPEGQESTCFC